MIDFVNIFRYVLIELMVLRVLLVLNDFRVLMVFGFLVPEFILTPYSVNT